jgi:hypothetical protein
VDEIHAFNRSFRSQQDGVLVTAGISGIAEDLAGVVDSDGIRDGDAGVGGDQRIEIEQRAVIVDEADVLAGLERMVARCAATTGGFGE